MNTVGKAAILGFVKLIVMLGFTVFLPAWTLNYWQAWIYLAIFVGSSLLVTIYLWKNDPKLLERRVSAGPTAEKETTQKVIQALASVAFILVLLIPGFDHRLHWSDVSTLFVIVSDCVLILGFLLVFFVFRENTFTSATIEVASDQKVISTGPYRFVRHPMYIGGLLIMLASPVALGSYLGLLFDIPMVAAIVWRLLDEEKFLSANLPGYKEYCLKTRYRLIPFVW